jgi:hypothetical protein
MALLREVYKTLLRFVDLTDVPPYAGAAGRLLRVNATTNAIEYVLPGNAYQLNTGVSPGDLVRLDSSGWLPAVDGRALTNVTVPDGNRGDITVTGNTWTINTVGGGAIGAGTLTLDKLQAIPSLTILGNPGGAAASPTTLILGNGFTLTGNTLSVTSGGTVTSVGLSLPGIFSTGGPVTTAGDLTATLNSQASRTVFIAPPGGGAPTFRALTELDLPTISVGSITGLGSAAYLDHGIASGNLVRLGVDGLPAVAGSQLTGLSAAALTGTIARERLPLVTRIRNEGVDVGLVNEIDFRGAGVSVGVTNGVAEVLLQEFEGFSITSETLTLTGNYTLTSAAKRYQYLDPGGEQRDVVLPTPPSLNDWFTITNTGDGSVALAVKTTAGGAADIFLFDGGDKVRSVLAHYDGFTWNLYQVGFYAGETAAGVTDGNKGDITVTAGTWTINEGAVTPVKMSLIPTGALLGNAGSGNGHILLGTGLSLAGNTLNASGGVSSVGLSLPGIFSVTNSPITSSGTLTAALINQTARTVFIAPSTTGAPTFRLLEAADIPTLPASILGSGIIAPARLGTGTADSTTILHGDGVYRALTSGGTVTSVGLSLPGIFSITNSPVTTNGTLTAALTNQSANNVFAAPSGTAGTPSFRTLVPADIPNLPASILTTGLIAAARLGTGIADNTTTLHGDGVWRVAGSGAAAVEIQDEGITLTSGLSRINFAGAGVTTTNTGGAVTVTIPGGGGGGGGALEVVNIESSLLTGLNYVSNGDTNGLMHYLGTNEGASAWTNPVSNGQVSLSGLANADRLTNRLIDNNELTVALNTTHHVVYDLGTARFRANRFIYNAQINGGVLSATLSYSSNGVDWINAIADVQSTQTFGTSWVVSPLITLTPAARYWRISLTVPSTSFASWTEIEMYGEYIPTSVVTVNLSSSYLAKLAVNAVYASSFNLVIPNNSYPQGWYCYLRNDRTSTITLIVSPGVILVAPNGAELRQNELGLLVFNGTSWHFQKLTGAQVQPQNSRVIGADYCTSAGIPSPFVLRLGTWAYDATLRARVPANTSRTTLACPLGRFDTITTVSAVYHVRKGVQNQEMRIRLFRSTTNDPNNLTPLGNFIFQGDGNPVVYKEVPSTQVIASRGIGEHRGSYTIECILNRAGSTTDVTLTFNIKQNGRAWYEPAIMTFSNTEILSTDFLFLEYDVVGQGNQLLSAVVQLTQEPTYDGVGSTTTTTTDIITTDTTLERRAFSTYLINTEVTPVTITLPIAPQDNDVVELADYSSTFGTFPLSIQPNNQQLLLGGTIPLILDRNKQAIRLVFRGGRWSALAGMGENTTLEQFSTNIATLNYLLTNPSFETPLIGDNSFSGSPADGWPGTRVVRGNGGGYNPPTPYPSGLQAIFFQVVPAGVVGSTQQVITIPPNCLAIRLTFSHSRRANAGLVTHRIDIAANGTIFGVVDPTSNNNWITYTTPWHNVAPGSSITLVISVTQIGPGADHTTFVDNLLLEGQFTNALVENVPLSRVAVLPFTNGNFELPAISNNTNSQLIPTGWTASSIASGSSNNYLTRGSGGYSQPTPVPNGEQVLVLQTLNNAGVQLLQQVIPIPLDCTFIRVTFQYARRNQGYVVNQTIDTLVNNLVVGSIPSNSIYTWTQFSTLWVAVQPGTNITLGIRATGNQATDYTTFIDGVVIEGNFSSLPYVDNPGITTLITTSTTLAAQRRQVALVSTRDGALTLTLPASPVNGDVVEIGDALATTITTGFGLNRLTLQASQNHTIVGNTTLILDRGGQGVELVFHSNRWSITSGAGEGQLLLEQTNISRFGAFTYYWNMDKEVSANKADEISGLVLSGDPFTRFSISIPKLLYGLRNGTTNIANDNNLQLNGDFEIIMGVYCFNVNSEAGFAGNFSGGTPWDGWMLNWFQGAGFRMSSAHTGNNAGVDAIVNVVPTINTPYLLNGYYHAATNTLGMSVNRSIFTTVSLNGAPRTNTRQFNIGNTNGWAIGTSWGIMFCGISRRLLTDTERDYIFNNGSWNLRGEVIPTNITVSTESLHALLACY